MSKYRLKSKESKKRRIQNLGLFEPVHGECLVTKSDDILNFVDVDSLDTIDKHETNKSSITCVAISEMSLDGDDPVIITGGRDKYIQIWNPLSGELERHVELPTSEVRCISTYTGSELYIILGTRDGKVILYDIRKNQIITILTGHAGVVYTVSLTSFIRSDQIVDRNDLANLCVVSAGADRSALTWDLKKNRHKKKFRHQWSVYTLVVANKGLNRPILAAGGANGDIKLWDVKTAVALRSLSGHSARVNSLTLWEESFQILLVSASADHTLRVYDLISGECVCILHGHKSPVLHAVITDASKQPRLVSLAEDSELVQWDLYSLVSDMYITQGPDVGTRNDHPAYLPAVALPVLTSQEDSSKASLSFSSDEKDLLKDLKNRKKGESKAKRQDLGESGAVPVMSSTFPRLSGRGADGLSVGADDGRSRTDSMSSVSSEHGVSRKDQLNTSPLISSSSRKTSGHDKIDSGADLSGPSETRRSRHEHLSSSPYIDNHTRKRGDSGAGSTPHANGEAISPIPIEARKSRHEHLSSSPYIDNHTRKRGDSGAGSTPHANGEAISPIPIEARKSRHEHLSSSPYIDNHARKSGLSKHSIDDYPAHTPSADGAQDLRVSRNELLASSPHINRMVRGGSGASNSTADKATEVLAEARRSKRVAPQLEGESSGNAGGGDVSNKSEVIAESTHCRPRGSSRVVPLAPITSEGEATSEAHRRKSKSGGVSGDLDLGPIVWSGHGHGAPPRRVSRPGLTESEAPGSSTESSNASEGVRPVSPVRLVAAVASPAPHGRVAAARSASIQIMGNILNKLVAPSASKVGIVPAEPTQISEPYKSSLQESVEASGDTNTASTVHVKYGLPIVIAEPTATELTTSAIAAGSVSEEKNPSPVQIDPVDGTNLASMESSSATRETVELQGQGHDAAPVDWQQVEKDIFADPWAVDDDEDDEETPVSAVLSSRTMPPEASAPAIIQPIEESTVPSVPTMNCHSETKLDVSDPTEPHREATSSALQVREEDALPLIHSTPSYGPPQERESSAKGFAAVVSAALTSASSDPEERRNKDYRSLKSDFNVAQVEKGLEGEQRREQAALRLVQRLMKKKRNVSAEDRKDEEQTPDDAAGVLTSMADLEALKAKKLLQHKHQHARVQQSILIAKDKASSALQRRLDEMLERKKNRGIQSQRSGEGGDEGVGSRDLGGSTIAEDNEEYDEDEEDLRENE